MRGKSNGSSHSRSTTKRPRAAVEEDTPVEGEEEREEVDLRNSISNRRRNKRRRFRTTSTTTIASNGVASSSLVLVSGLPEGCTVLELKSRFEMYGPVSRIRIEGGGSGLVTYRSLGSAQAAVSASLQPGFGIVFHSKRVHVRLVNEPRVEMAFSPSKLLRSEIPLSKHGRSNKKLNASGSINLPIMPFNGREIIAYDDLL